MKEKKDYDITLGVSNCHYMPDEIVGQINRLSEEVLGIEFEDGQAIITFSLDKPKKDILDVFNIISNGVIESLLINYYNSDVKLYVALRNDEYNKPQMIFDINHPKTISYSFSITTIKFI